MIRRSSLAVIGSIASSSHGKSSGWRLIHPPQHRNGFAEEKRYMGQKAQARGKAH
jgi:hypothetical protein